MVDSQERWIEILYLLEAELDGFSLLRRPRGSLVRGSKYSDQQWKSFYRTPRFIPLWKNGDYEYSSVVPRVAQAKRSQRNPIIAKLCIAVYT